MPDNEMNTEKRPPPSPITDDDEDMVDSKSVADENGGGLTIADSAAAAAIVDNIVDATTAKSRARLFNQILEKSKLNNNHNSNNHHAEFMDDRDIEQELLHARQLTLEKAQADLLAGFGVGFPAFGGLHYVPARHPFLPTALQQAAVAAAAAAQAKSTADLLNLSMLRGGCGSPPSMVLHGGGDRLSGGGSSGGGTCNGRESPLASSTSPEPEDLSMRTSPSRDPLLMLSNGAGGSKLDRGMSRSPNDPSLNAGSSQQPQSWSFEEQFKQLYELSNDQKRKDFLDELFSFMQKRGTPVTRIPIMAKQVLDLYELYKLVVSHGGLVEVINKKLWREITKGLNLPSSITSAAFTLRTQYMKYLYPYECEKERLSSPAELQSAIDGNRREGRRSGYHPYSQISPTLIPRHLNGGGALIPDDDGLVPTPSLSQQQQQAFAAAYREQALALEAAQRHYELSQRENHHQRHATNNTTTTGTMSDRVSSCSGNESNQEDEQSRATPLAAQSVAAAGVTGSSAMMATVGGPPSGVTKFPSEAPSSGKRFSLGDAAQSSLDLSSTGQDRLLSAAPNLTGIPTTHIKVTSRGDGRNTVDSSLVVSMEINGIMYQGVLFAQPAATAIRLNALNP